MPHHKHQTRPRLRQPFTAEILGHSGGVLAFEVGHHQTHLKACAATSPQIQPCAGALVSGNLRDCGPERAGLRDVPRRQLSEGQLQEAAGLHDAPEDHADCPRDKADDLRLVGHGAAHQLHWRLAHGVRLR